MVVPDEVENMLQEIRTNAEELYDEACRFSEGLEDKITREQFTIRVLVFLKAQAGEKDIALDIVDDLQIEGLI